MRPLILTVLVTGLLGGCVKKGVHEGVLDELAQTQSELEGTGEQLRHCENRATAVEAQLAETARDLEQEQGRVSDCSVELTRTRALLEASGEEAQLLASRLADLSAVEAELRERDNIFRSIIQRFQSLIDTGMLEVVVQDGRLKLQLPQDILFEPGRADIGEDGVLTLTEVGGVLATLDDRQFEVEGHTDNVPITRTFASNWELSTARALAVVHIFLDAGVPAQNISAAGFGDSRPRASNDDDEGRALNRRIEIVMVPNLEAIFGDVTPE